MCTKSQQSMSQGVLSQEYNSQCPQSVKTKHSKKIAAFIKVNHHLKWRMLKPPSYLKPSVQCIAIHFILVMNYLDFWLSRTGSVPVNLDNTVSEFQWCIWYNNHFSWGFALYRESPKSILSWNLTKLFFGGKIPSIRASFQSLFPGFLQSLFPGFDRRGSNIGREFVRNSIIWIDNY